MGGAQPDEVVNYKTGDGLEKAFVLANIIRNSARKQDIEIHIDNSEVIVAANKSYKFCSEKGLYKQININRAGGIKIK